MIYALTPIHKIEHMSQMRKKPLDQRMQKKLLKQTIILTRLSVTETGGSSVQNRSILQASISLRVRTRKDQWLRMRNLARACARTLRGRLFGNLRPSRGHERRACWLDLCGRGAVFRRAGSNTPRPVLGFLPTKVRNPPQEFQH